MTFFNKFKNLVLENTDEVSKPNKVTESKKTSETTSTQFPRQQQTVPTQVVENVYRETSEQLDQYVQTQPMQTQPHFIAQPTFTQPQPQVINHVNNCDVEVKQVVEQYEAHLEKVNLDGYDFYEFYKSVMSIGIDNVSAYPIIFKTAQTIYSDLTAQKITETGQYYIQEITKAFVEFDTLCSEKLQKLEEQKASEKEFAQLKLNEINSKIQTLQAEYNETINELNSVDSKYIVETERVKCLSFANNTVKGNLEQTINKVISNINF